MISLYVDKMAFFSRQVRFLTAKVLTIRGTKSVRCKQEVRSLQVDDIALDLKSVIDKFVGDISTIGESMICLSDEMLVYKMPVNEMSVDQESEDKMNVTSDKMYAISEQMR